MRRHRESTYKRRHGTRARIACADTTHACQDKQAKQRANKGIFRAGSAEHVHTKGTCSASNRAKAPDVWLSLSLVMTAAPPPLSCAHLTNTPSLYFINLIHLSFRLSRIRSDVRMSVKLLSNIFPIFFLKTKKIDSTNRNSGGVRSSFWELQRVRARARRLQMDAGCRNTGTRTKMGTIEKKINFYFWWKSTRLKILKKKFRPLKTSAIAGH